MCHTIQILQPPSPLILSPPQGLRDQMVLKYQVKGIPQIKVMENRPGANAAPLDSQGLVQEFAALSQGASIPYQVLTKLQVKSNSALRLSEGVRVKVNFLTSKPELNGRMGKVVGYKGAHR